MQLFKILVALTVTYACWAATGMVAAWFAYKFVWSIADHNMDDTLWYGAVGFAVTLLAARNARIAESKLTAWVD